MPTTRGGPPAAVGGPGQAPTPGWGGSRRPVDGVSPAGEEDAGVMKTAGQAAGQRTRWSPDGSLGQGDACPVSAVPWEPPAPSGSLCLLLSP